MDAVRQGLLPVTARDRAREWLDSRLVGDSLGEDPSRLMARSCRAWFAGLVGADADSVRMTSSLSAALVELADMLAVRQGANIVLCSALSDPGFVAYWRNHAAHHRLELREVPPGPSGFEIAELFGRIDGHTRLVALPAVTHVRGWRLPLGDIGGLCRKKNIFFLVDGTSSVGILQTDVVRESIDGLVVAAHENALGLDGLGFMYVAQGWRERRIAGSVPLTAHALQEDCDGKHMIGLVMAFEALGVISACGVARIERHALGLAERLRLALEELGLFVERPRDRRQLGHVTAVGAPAVAGTCGAAALADLQVLADQLVAGRVRFTVRGGQLLFGFHLYNKLRDVMEVRRIVAQSLAV